MKKVLYIILMFILAAGACFILIRKTGKGEITDLSTTLPDKEKEDEVQKLLDNMTLEEKIGQMLFIDIQKPVLEDSDIDLLKTIKPGGFILFGPNFSTYSNTLKLIKDVKATSDIPMFIGIDEEGGRVARIDSLVDEEVTKIPNMLAVGKTNDESIALGIGRILGNKLGVFGINMDFAPVIDIYSNPDNKVIGNRSFGSSPDNVYNMAKAVANGLSEKNVISVYKHFPGHGDTAKDSHYELPVIEKDLNALKEFELVPFQKAIDDGAEVIMIGHLSVPNISKDNTPASLSKDVITNLLINDMGYKNLVITDSLKMKAITDNYEEKEIYRLAINAGVNILLMPNNPKYAVEVIKQMVEDGEIDEELINNSVLKILRLKELKVSNNYDTYLDKSYLNKEEYKEVLNKIN